MRRSIAAAVLIVTPAYADTLAIREAVPPRAQSPASLSLPAGKVSLTLTAEIESSAGKLGEPVALAPDVEYGVTRDLTISVVHSRFATTGFRAVTGGGVCLGGDAACSHVYNNAGGEALYSLRRGSLAIAALGGVHALDFDRGFVDAKLGGRIRCSHGRATLLASPSVLVALTERSDAMPLNKDMLYVPILASYQVLPPLAIGLGSGIKGPLAELGSGWEIPLGAVATYRVDPRVSVGASFVFGKLIGGADATGTDFRGTQVWVTVAP